MKIYLSYTPLATDTELIRTRLGRLDCVFVVDRSTLGARSGALDQVISSELARSDLFIGVFSPGCERADDSLCLSLCEFEYRKALLLGVPRLLYIEDGFPMEVEAAPLRHLIEKNDLPLVFRDSSMLTTQMVTDVYNFTFRSLAHKTSESPSSAEATMETGSPPPSVPEQSIKDPEPVEWYKSWKHWFDEHIFPDSPVLRRLLQTILITLLAVAGLFKLYGVPQPVSDWISTSNQEVAIFLGGPPRPSHEAVHDLFVESSLDPAKWNSGAHWTLMTTDSPEHSGLLIIKGSDIGVIRVPTHFESYYDMQLSFQVPIITPATQQSLAWIVRLEHGWHGDSYYRFTLTFPTSLDQHLHLSAGLYTNGQFDRFLGIQPTIPFYPFVAGSTLNVITTLRGSAFDVALRYSDACSPPSCTQYNDGTERHFPFEDTRHTLAWGLVGFTNPESNGQIDLQNFDLTPIGGTENGH